MSTTTKAAPKAAAKNTPAPKKGYSVIKKDAAPETTKVFEIPKGGGIVTKIKSEVSVYDPSVFRDEQNEKSRREHVLFRNGLLAVPYNKPNLAKFMELHTSNIANGGKLFKIVDNSRDSEEVVNSEFLTHDAVSLVRTKGSDEILAVALSLGINIEQQMIDIRREMLREAKSSPATFIAMFDDPRVKTRSAIIQSNDFQIISCKPDGVYWFDSGRLIISVPAGQDPKDMMVRFCLTEKGASVYEELISRLEKLS